MSAQRVPKPWGYELIWAWTGQYAGKLLSIRQGCRLSLQFHEQKHESLYLLMGLMELELEDEHGQITRYQARPGDTFQIPARRRHRLHARTPCLVLEASTPELEDIVRLQDDYGRC